MDVKIGKGTMEIGDRVIKLIGNRVLSLSVITVKGPCTDEMCSLIRKPKCNVTDNYVLQNAYVVKEPIKIEMPQELYYSIDREREHIKVKISLNGKIEIKGLSLIDAA